MATLGIKIKIMPESLDTDLEAIKVEATKMIDAQKGRISGFEEQEIAFGLKALIATIVWPEEQDSDIVQNTFNLVPGVSSTEVLDVRRVIG